MMPYLYSQISCDISMKKIWLHFLTLMIAFSAKCQFSQFHQISNPEYPHKGIIMYMDNDGDNDIVTNGQLKIWVNNGNMQFSPIELDINVDEYDFLLHDINNDNLPDILYLQYVLYEGTHTKFILNLGDINFAAPQMAAIGEKHLGEFANVNGDEFPDLRL
jgi:hypothetical protein